MDAWIRNGSFGPLDFPAVLGFDAAGTVDSVGEKVSNVKVRKS